jgi:murein DD-endopeptidase MepM/ murein hydrolase activator NlpD
MAMVPDSFVPSATVQQIGISPLSASGVQPMQNRAPEQMQQAGEASQRLGTQTVDIGERIQNQLDDAMAKQAETGFLQQAMTIANGDGKDDPGYLNLKGQAAIDGLPTAQESLAKAKQAGLDGLSNDFQKAMYSRVANQHLLSFGTQFVDHHFQQGSQYYTEASANRATAYATNASMSASSYGQTNADGAPTGDFFKNVQVAEQETLSATQRSKGAPPGSEIANQALLNLHTQIGTGALSQMMDARLPYTKVESVFNDMKSKGWLDIRAMDSLGKMVSKYSEQEMTRTAINSSLSDAVRKSQGQPTISVGTPDYQFPIDGATATSSSYDPEEGNLTVMIPTGSSIKSPAAGKVTQVGRDEDDNLMLKIEHADGSVTAFAGLNSANVKVGDSVTGGEDVATSGAVDNKASVLWSLTDSKGVKVNPTTVGLAPVDLTKVTDENVLSDALDRVRKQITDPVLQQQATSEMEGMVRHNQQMANAAKTQLFQSATNAFYSNGMQWRNIPPTVFNQLPPEQQQHFKDLQTSEVLKNFEQGQQFKNMSETGLIANFIENPDTLTPDNVNAVRSQLSNSSYLTFLGRAESLKNNPKGVEEASGINTRMDYYARQNGMVIGGKMTQTQKDDLTNLKMRITEGIDALKTQNHGKATSEQVDKLIQQQFVQHTLSIPRSPWNPIAILGSPNSTQKKFTFQMPAGATHVAPGSDGKLHYTDGTRDLGAVN